METFISHIIEIELLCKKFHVAQLYVFGSFAKENYRADSDIDFLVYFDDDIPLLDYADNFFDFIFFGLGIRCGVFCPHKIRNLRCASTLRIRFRQL